MKTGDESLLSEVLKFFNSQDRVIELIAIGCAKAVVGGKNRESDCGRSVVAFGCVSSGRVRGVSRSVSS